MQRLLAPPYYVSHIHTRLVAVATRCPPLRSKLEQSGLLPHLAALLFVLQDPALSLAILRGRRLQGDILRKVIGGYGYLEVGGQVVLHSGAVVGDIPIDLVFPVYFVSVDVLVLDPQVHLELRTGHAVHGCLEAPSGHLPHLPQVLPHAPLLGDHEELPRPEGLVPAHALHALPHRLDDSELPARLVFGYLHVVVHVLPVDLVLQLLLDLVEVAVSGHVKLARANGRTLHDGAVASGDLPACGLVLVADCVAQR
mmetsp:Transcript_29914/g.67899  ORF Transcript_29914/g.67899 Transcript_29914/m.67899 type:complete len:254 (+) Transcript_29914:3-764(+)